MVWATTGCNERHGTLAVVLTPHRYIVVHVDHFAGWPRLGIDIPNLFSRRGANDGSVGRSKSDAIDLVKGLCGVRSEDRHQLFQCEFALTCDYDIRAGIEILTHICAGLRPAHDRLPGGLFCDPQ